MLTSKNSCSARNNLFYQFKSICLIQCLISNSKRQQFSKRGFRWVKALKIQNWSPPRFLKVSSFSFLICKQKHYFLKIVHSIKLPNLICLLLPKNLYSISFRMLFKSHRAETWLLELSRIDFLMLLSSGRKCYNHGKSTTSSLRQL